MSKPDKEYFNITDQQIAEMGKWQFRSAIAVVLFCTSLLSVIVYQRVAIRIGGGRA